MQPSNYVGASEDKKINYTQCDLIIHKQPHKESCTPPTEPVDNIYWKTVAYELIAASANLFLVMGSPLFWFLPSRTVLLVNHSRTLRGQLPPHFPKMSSLC